MKWEYRAFSDGFRWSTRSEQRPGVVIRIDTWNPDTGTPADVELSEEFYLEHRIKIIERWIGLKSHEAEEKIEWVKQNLDAILMERLL